MNPGNPLPIPNDEIALYQFKKIIETLTNDQGIITSLAQMAVFNANHADLYVEIIFGEYMKSRNPEKRLYLLYVIDMIVKIDMNRVYLKYFAPNITNIFTETYTSANEQVRMSLWQLYLTWTNVFPDQTLNQIRTALTMISQGYRNSAAFQMHTSHQQTQPTVIPVSYDSQGSIPINVTTQSEPFQNATFTPVRRYKQPKQYNYNTSSSTPRKTPKKQSKPASPINIPIEINDNSSLPPSTDPSYRENKQFNTSTTTNIPVQLMSPTPVNIPVDISSANQMSPMYSQTSSVITEPSIFQMNQPSIKVPTSEFSHTNKVGEICPICGGKFVDMERHVKYHQVLNACGGLQPTPTTQNYNDQSFIQQEEETYQQPSETDPTMYFNQDLVCALCGKPLAIITTANGDLYLKDGTIDNQGRYVHQQCLFSSSSTA